MLSEDIQKKIKECREKTRKQKRDTNTKLKTHLNVTPKTNEKRNKLIRKKLQRENKKLPEKFLCIKRN